ncbi:MAG: CPBP family intramembrane metalloprotease [Planctomycetaceae bacterium]|nr:CPBP family intramembrane metalloprotease [Planctomycetaceae bacterium]
MLTKTIMLAIPIFYTLTITKERFCPRPFNKRGLIEGNLFGFGVLLLICFLYFCWLKPIGLIGHGTPVGNAIRERVQVFGFTNLAAFVLFGIFVSLIHSALEEYYWRWFTFGQLLRKIPKLLAIIISGLGFMLHHVVILGVYFRFDHPATWIFSFAVAIGGMYWSWLYSRKDSIYASWLSHAWIDVAIFIVGYDVLFVN